MTSNLGTSWSEDICRVCRSEGSHDKPLFHPCICTGSIKFIHQECLLQWLKYSRKEYCELCNHRFSFMPIYSPDMPKRLPVKDIFSGLLRSLGTAIRFWLHYTLVAVAWLGIVPLTACRIYRCLFTGSFSSLLSLPLELFSTENILSDSLYGCCVVTCTLCAFISLVWLREQILHGGGPDWLEQEQEQHVANLHVADNNNIPNVNLAGAAAPINQHVANIHAADNNNINVAGPLNQHGANNNNGPNVNVAGAVPMNPDQDADNENDNNAAQDDINWNPIEWDRAAEELTWERLLGLDGSLVFLEHVFWVVSLNTLFILLFAFFPYHIGQLTVSGLGLKSQISATEFEGLLTTFCGYLLVGVVLALLHGGAALVRLQKTKRLLGLCYVVIKVSLLSVVEVGVFPLVCGWWLDICSLTLLDASIKDREASFRLAPGTSMFIHWLVGMVYVFYFASFILLLREVLRPGVLWFLRNLNDPDFNPIYEMIHLPVLRHTRRFLASLITFGTTVLLMVWLPIRIIEYLAPEFLPYYVMITSDMPMSELSLELILLQVVLPALLEQGHTRQWLKLLVRGWCICVSYMLDLRSYLLGDVVVQPPSQDQANPPVEPAIVPQDVRAGGRLGVAHQALFQSVSQSTALPYKKPKFMAFKIFCLVLCICVSLTLASLLMLTVPVFIGRKIMAMWMGTTRVHELYTVGCGLYACWLSLRLLSLLFSWIPMGWASISAKLKEWMSISIKSMCAMSVMLGIVPLLMGLLFDLLIIVPLRVPLHQTPLISLWQDWALGVLHTKIMCALTLMGPNWWLKRVIEQVYLGGFRNINLHTIFIQLALPLVMLLGLCLSVPYIYACSILPMFTTSFETQNLVLRRIYPAVLVLLLLSGAVVFQIRQFFRLYEHIKNDKYLVGKRLVNYDHRHNALLSQANAGDSVAS